MPAAHARRQRNAKLRQQLGGSLAVAAGPATAVVTAVAITARPKMLWKHGVGRISHTNIPWEISMPFANSLPDAPRSSRVRALRLVEQHIASGPASKSDDEFETSLLPFPRQEPPRRTVQGAVRRLMAETVAFSVHAGNVVPTVPIAIVSWLIAEFFAGCAAYAQAMYPVFPPEDDVDRGDLVPPVASHPGHASRRRPVLRLVPATAERGSEKDGAVAFPARNPPGAHAPYRAEFLLQPEPARTARADWCASFSAAATALLSKMRIIRARRRATVELESFDDRTLRDIGICRGDIEAVVRQGSRWK
jgi:uncharacterized protein YjiS (DUF1127 family)